MAQKLCNFQRCRSHNRYLLKIKGQRHLEDGQGALRYVSPNRVNLDSGGTASFKTAYTFERACSFSEKPWLTLSSPDYQLSLLANQRPSSVFWYALFLCAQAVSVVSNMAPDWQPGIWGHSALFVGVNLFFTVILNRVRNLLILQNLNNFRRFVVMQDQFEVLSYNGMRWQFETLGYSRYCRYKQVQLYHSNK